jgi:sugar phosphate isomerase/epimerase
MSYLISISSAPFACLGDKKYYDLLGTVDVMKRILSESIVDGFELQMQPEWDREQPPLTDTEFADWTTTPKYTAREILELLKGENLPILSVHASRDIGNYFCSSKKWDWEKGKKVARDALFLAKELGAEICVFHLWNTRAEKFNLKRLKELFQEVAEQFSSIKASVENIPTCHKDATPFRLVREFEHVTLDLRWAAMYNEFALFQSIVDKLANVHLRGKLEGKRWLLDRSSFSFYEAVNKIKNEWGYKGLLTVEREGTLNSLNFSDFVEAMKHLRSLIHDDGT